LSIIEQLPPTPTGRRAKLPRRLAERRGLSDDTIEKIRRRSEKLAQSTRASFAAVFVAKAFAALAEQGYARLSMREILTLAQQTADIPTDLAVACAAFLAAHPPLDANYAILSEAIRRGAVCGVPGLVQLHKHIVDRQRKAAVKRFQRSALTVKPDPARPKLLPAEERAKAKATRAKQVVEREIEASNQALAALYSRRFAAEMKPHLEFIEVCQALRDSGFGLIERHRQRLLEIAEETAV
jgi:hypothetical protein